MAQPQTFQTTCTGAGCPEPEHTVFGRTVSPQDFRAMGALHTITGTVTRYSVSYYDERGHSVVHIYPATPEGRSDALDMLHRLSDQDCTHGSNCPGIVMFPASDSDLPFVGWDTETVAVFGYYTGGYDPEDSGNWSVHFHAVVQQHVADPVAEAAWITAVRTGRSIPPELPTGYAWGEHDPITGEAHMMTPDGRDLTELAWRHTVCECGMVFTDAKAHDDQWHPTIRPNDRDAWSADPDRTTRNGDTGPDGNPYAMGTLEWHAWGAGHTYGLTHPYQDAPLSGEWSGGPLPQDVILAAWKAVMGTSWDTYSDGTDDDRDADSDILEAWEGGFYVATYLGHYGL